MATVNDPNAPAPAPTPVPTTVPAPAPASPEPGTARVNETHTKTVRMTKDGQSLDVSAEDLESHRRAGWTLG